MKFGIVELYCGKSGEKGFYNSQQIGLARAITRLGYEVFVFIPTKSAKNISEEIVDGNIKVVTVPVKCIGTHSKYDGDIFLKYRMDAVLLAADGQLFAPDLLRFFDKNHIRVCTYIGTVGTDSNNKIKQGIMKTLFKRNIKEYKKHKNFAKTKAVQKQLEDYGIVDVEVASVGLDLSAIPYVCGGKEQLRKELNISADKKVVLFVGRIDAYKRPEMMVELMKNLPLDCCGIIIGDGTLAESIENGIRSNRLKDRITWIKKIPNAEIHKYFKMADYFVNFNDQEIFGMSILEAMYQGCTVIAFHAPGPDEIIENGITGYLVDNINEVFDIVVSGVHMDERIPREKVLQSFTWDLSVQKINNWIKEKE